MNSDELKELRTQAFQDLQPSLLMKKLDLLQSDILLSNQKAAAAVNNLLSRLVYLEAQSSIFKEVIPNCDELVSKKLDEIHNRRNLTEEDEVQLNDAIVASFTGYNEEGEVDPQMSVKDKYFVVNLKNFIPDLEEKFIGMKLGEKKKVKAKFPEEYPMKPDMAGKSFSFELEVVHGKRSLD